MTEPTACIYCEREVRAPRRFTCGRPECRDRGAAESEAASLPDGPQDPLTLLGYLWDATGKNPDLRVRDLFADDDPLVADVEKALSAAEKGL